jgi:uncharacterized protein YceK
MPGRLRPLLVVVLAVAALLSGCGEDERHTAYVERVDAAQRAFADRVEELSEGVTATSSARQDRATLARFEQALDEVVGELRAIAPPGEVRGLHARLVAALAGYERDVAGVVRALDGDSPARLRAAQRELQQATSDVDGEINRTTAAINDALRG